MDNPDWLESLVRKTYDFNFGDGVARFSKGIIGNLIMGNYFLDKYYNEKPYDRGN